MCIHNSLCRNVHVVQNWPSVFIEIQIHVIVWITFRIQVKFTLINLQSSNRLMSSDKTFFQPVCRAKTTYRGFSSWVAVLMAHECLIVRYNSGNSYRFHERKSIMKYRPLSKARSIDSLFISFNDTCGIRHCILNISIADFSAKFPIRQLLSCAWSYQNQFVTSVDHHASVIFAKF